LKEKLQHKSLRQLRQRILVHYDLRPLSREEMEQYIRYRLILAGANGRPEFTKAAMKKVYKNSRGIPRLVNNLCDKSILSAYIKRRDMVTWWDVRRAAREMKKL
jgi:general secretion pathway protein A